ncbi:hypothetical protein PMZ80_004861 [Knufia obscura]|uniref:Uncharacterized protein n=1 Tax=Knufia obscura TaxID=1635080 RepID=A0ABR0RP05_9EURO|nr:hypothetical protein PMZ80_004861 [Knufia obscura]
MDFPGRDWTDAERDDFYSNPEAMLRALGAGVPGGLPMPEFTTAKEVRQIARPRSAKVIANHELLGAILDRHEATIQKRWTKKTKGQRLKILLSAWPDMSISHRPGFAAMQREHNAQRLGSQHRDAFLFPYINQEDLSKTKTLPLFLHARGRHQPCEFSMSDFEAIHLGITSKAIVPVFLNEYVMMFTGRDTTDKYGELLSWDDHPDAFDWMHQRIGTLPGEGLLVLEIQDRILQFLIKCCQEILHDLGPQQLASEEYPIQPDFQPPSENDSAGFSSLTVMAMEAPYRAPAALDWPRVGSLLAAKKAAAEDHVWYLREDPSYFADCVLEYKEHRQELVKDTHGQAHPVFKYRQDDVFWGRVVGNVVTNAYLSLEVWSELHSQATKLQDLELDHRNDIKQGEALPEQYLEAILKFQHYLKQAAKGPLGLLKHSVVGSPAFRSMFVRIPPENITTPNIQVKQKSGLRLDKEVTHLMLLLRTLWEDDEGLFLMGMTNVVDELQRLLQSEPKANEMISSFLAEVIGDLSISCECLRQLETYQPWAATFENALVNREDGIKRQFAEVTAPWGAMMAALKSVEGISHHGNPEDGKFRYPIEKRKTKENVEQLRSAEQSLDRFWENVDRITSRARGFQDLATGTLLAQERVLRRTPEWTQPGKKDGSTAEVQVEELYKPLSELYFELERRTGHKTERFEVPKQKKKEKTKGTSSAATASGPDGTAQDTTDAQPTFAVDNRALKVFRTLFYTPSLTATPGEVSWTDFLHALTSTGFAAEKLYGSVWQFSPQSLDVERSIQFHEPHPSGKLAYRVARRLGRRLSRAYGWDGKMFVLAEKKSQDSA